MLNSEKLNNIGKCGRFQQLAKGPNIWGPTFFLRTDGGEGAAGTTGASVTSPHMSTRRHKPQIPKQTFQKEENNLFEHVRTY